MTDGNLDTYWAVEDDNLTPSAVITLPKPATFDVIRLREQIRLGQRVDSFNIDAFIKGKWVCIDNGGKTIGNQVMRRLDRPITAQKLRLRITGSQATPCISEFALFRQPAGAVRPSIFRRGDNLVILADGKNKILYTTDGSEPKAGSSVYSQGAKFSESGVVKARCQFANGKLGPVSQAKFGISKTGWKVKSTTSGNAAAAIDDNPETSWTANAGVPQSFVVDMGKPYQVTSFSYLPRQDGKTEGMTDKYQFEVSADGKTWKRRQRGNSPISAPIPSSKTSTSRMLTSPCVTSALPEQMRWTAAELPPRKSMSSALPPRASEYSAACLNVPARKDRDVFSWLQKQAHLSAAKNISVSRLPDKAMAP